MTISVGNSYSKVEGMTSAQYKELRSILSYTEGDHFSRFGPVRKYLIDANGNFPTGLLGRILNLFPHTPCLPIRVRPKTTAEFIRKQGHVPYPDQIAAASSAYDHHRGIVSMPTGSGKSVVISLIIQNCGVRTLVIVPSVEIKKQLSADLKQTFGSLKNITVENIDSKALLTAKDYDCLIIDEAHHVASKTYQNLNKKSWGGIYYRYMLTATPFRTVADEQLLFEAIAGDVIYRLSYKDAVTRGYIVPIDAYVLTIPKTPNDYYSWPEVYRHLVVENNIRNEIIAELVTSLVSAGQSTLLLVKEVRHGELLAELIGLPFANGQDEESRVLIPAFSSGKLTGLIATEGICAEGVDTKACEWVIIAGLGKAKSSLMQKIGRSVRRFEGKESGKVVICYDPSHKFTKSHYQAQVKVLKEEYNVEVIKL
jgi:superfamily II DNA or RNA helicase